MATLTVGDVEDTVVERLRRRAAARGRSAEAEHRAILQAALSDGEWTAVQRDAADRLEALQERIAERGTVDAGALLRESRETRVRQLMGDDRGDGR